TPTQEDRDAAVGELRAPKRAVVGNNEIGPTVAVEIARRQGTRTYPGRLIDGGLECPIAIAQKDRDAGRLVEESRIGNCQVGFAIAIEVAHHDGKRIGSRAV